MSRRNYEFMSLELRVPGFFFCKNADQLIKADFPASYYIRVAL